MALSRSLKLSVLALGLTVAGCDRQSGREAQPQASTSASEPLSGEIDRSHKGSQMPDLTFKDAAGKELRLTALAGKPALVNLWATWCGPCVAELPTLAALATRAGAPQVVTISEDMGDPAKVAAFLAERKLAALPGWLDPENAAGDHYKVTTLPTTIYYDAKGREVWRYVGGHDWGDGEAAKMFAEAG